MRHGGKLNKKNVRCPDNERLNRFLSAKLSDEENEIIELHLDTCKNCQKRLEELEREGAGRFNERFRRSSGGGTSLFGRESQQKLIELIGSSEKIEKIPEPIFSLPNRIGQYEILETLGSGGMGIVLKAKHVHLKREVALKLLKNSNRFHSLAIARFYREIEAIGKLDHANIVRASDAGVDPDGQPYLVMELLKGRDIESLIQSRRPLSVEDASKIVRQAAMGLDQVHQAGLIHRDIKPSNLFLTKNGVIKLLDLGLARLYENDPPDEDIDSTNNNPILADKDDLPVSSLTTRFTVVGSPHFIAPEQIEQSNAVDARADIYSLGCTFYFLLTGTTPYVGSQAEILGSHLQGVFPSTRQHREDIPPQFDNLIRMMTARKPQDRIASANETVEILGRLLSLLKQNPLSDNISPLLVSPPPVLDDKNRNSLQFPVRLILVVVLSFVTIVSGFFIGRRISFMNDNSTVSEKGDSVVSP